MWMEDWKTWDSLWQLEGRCLGFRFEWENSMAATDGVLEARWMMEG